MLKKIVMIAVLLTCSACYDLERKSGRVLDNAGSVVKEGGKNLWLEPEGGRNQQDLNKDPYADPYTEGQAVAPALPN
jgi:hypothetical protein